MEAFSSSNKLNRIYALDTGSLVLMQTLPYSHKTTQFSRDHANYSHGLHVFRLGKV